VKRDETVDAVSRAIMYPWVRECLELLSLLRSDLRIEQSRYEAMRGTAADQNVLGRTRITQRLRLIDSVFANVVESTSASEAEKRVVKELV
jgi:hypothetical protein